MSTNTSNSIINNISDNFKNLQNSVTNNMNEFSNVSNGTTTGNFDFMNGILAKFGFFILILIIFMLLLNLGAKLVSYFLKPSSKNIIINGMINGNSKTIITQDPNKNSNQVIYRSNNQKNGIEFTWTVWLLINDASNSSATFQPIFVKGGNTFNSDNISSVSNGPGVYLYPGSSKQPNKLHIIMDTVSTYASTLNQTIKNIEIIDIPNIPLKKWFLLTIRCENKYLDVYINGLVVFRRNLKNVPLQNYDDIHVCDSGGFNGNLSSLTYYTYALNAIDINGLANSGPNITNINPVPNTAYGAKYLSTNWYNQ
jgi:hypothetical protein